MLTDEELKAIKWRANCTVLFLPTGGYRFAVDYVNNATKDVNTMLEMVEDLRHQLAECQKDRDEWSSAMETYWKLANERLEALTKCQQENARLRAALEGE